MERGKVISRKSQSVLLYKGKTLDYYTKPELMGIVEHMYTMLEKEREGKAMQMAILRALREARNETP